MRKNESHRGTNRTGLNWLVILAAVGCTTAAPKHAGYQGIVELDERDLGFEEAGRVEAVGVVRGDEVEAGAELAKQDDAIARATMEARAAEVRVRRAQAALLRAGARREDVRGAEAELRASQKVVEQLERNWDETQALVARGAAGVSAVKNLGDDVARARQEASAVLARVQSLRSGARPEEIEAADAAVTGAEAALTVESVRLQHRSLKSELAGMVVDVHVEAGEVVGAGVPVVTVADVAHPYVDVFVPTAEVPGIAVGAPVQATIDGIPQAVAGKVEHIGRATEFTPKFLFSPRERPHLVVRVRVRLDDTGRTLRAGVPAFVTLAKS